MIKNSTFKIIEPGKRYTSLSQKVLDDKVKNGNEYKSPFKIPTTGIESTICHYPIRLDAYGNGCSHDCTYCYSKSINHFFQRWDVLNPLEADLNKIKATFYKIFETDKKDKMREHLVKYIPIRLGGMTDLFQSVEKDRKITFELLKLLNHYDYPAIIVTKGGVLYNNYEYLKVLSEGNYLVQITITTANDEYSKIVEPGAISSTDRFSLIKQLKSFGVPVQGRISPLFPIVPIGKDIDDTSAPRLNYFSFSLIDRIIEAGAFHIIVEFLRLSGFCRNFFRNATGIDLYEFYSQKESTSLLSYRQYPLEDKINLFKKIKDICLKSSIGFSVCPDEGDDPGMDTTVNCCGTDQLDGFQNCANPERLNSINEEQFSKYKNKLFSRKRELNHEESK